MEYLKVVQQTLNNSLSLRSDFPVKSKRSDMIYFGCNQYICNYECHTKKYIKNEKLSAHNENVRLNA